LRAPHQPGFDGVEVNVLDFLVFREQLRGYEEEAVGLRGAAETRRATGKLID
jgi:hypothetical protein